MMTQDIGALDKESFLSQSYGKLREAFFGRDGDRTIPNPEALVSGSRFLPSGADHNWEAGRGAENTIDHILADIVPALNNQVGNSRYYGLVTGGLLPVAEAADNIVTALDQNVQIQLPGDTLAFIVENAALAMAVSLLQLGTLDDWPGRTFSTGATASNILGLMCGRDAVIARRLPNGSPNTIAQLGMVAACAAADVQKIQVLTSMGHFSTYKAASIVGLGHASVVELPLSKDEPWRLDINAVERELARPGIACIIAVSAGEVNTGRFATAVNDMARLRSLVDRYRAWIHVDGAFGIFARILPQSPEFSKLHEAAAGLELADSITADAHKLLNVPYDCGIFLCKDGPILHQACSAPNAAYLTTSEKGVPNPLNNGLENSRRFRALPVYAVLLSEGRERLAQMLARQVRHARGIAMFLRESDDYELLPNAEARLEETHIIVLFRAKDPELNENLVQRINQSRRMFVSGTSWMGKKAVRIAVANWQADVECDLPVVKEVLLEVAASSGSQIS